MTKQHQNGRNYVHKAGQPCLATVSVGGSTELPCDLPVDHTGEHRSDFEDVRGQKVRVFWRKKRD